MNLLLLLLLSPLGTAGTYKNLQTHLHTIDQIQIRYAKDAEEESLLWKNQVERFQKKFPRSQKLFITLESGPIEALWIPQNKEAPLFILSSGIHGAEALTGTALQRLFLQHLERTTTLNANMLIVHAINPHGFLKFRRTNAKNVDLNRNFYGKNENHNYNHSYQKIRDILEPSGPVSTSLFQRWWFFARVGWMTLWNGKKEVLGALAGQHQSPRGLYFSGQTTQEETTAVQKWIEDFSAKTPYILHIDLHTGFGQRGRLHFYGSEEFSSNEQQHLLKKIFPSHIIDTAHNTDFYVTHGDLVDWTWKHFSNKKVIPMVFEFGTLDSQTLMGGLLSLWISVIENQGHHFGYASSEDEQKVQKLFELLFNPQNVEWQKTVLTQGLEALKQSLQNLEKLNPNDLQSPHHSH